MSFSSEAELRASLYRGGCLTCCPHSISRVERPLPLLCGMRKPRPDVTGYGLLLWSLRRSNNQYLSCQLGGDDSDFVLLIRDHQRHTVRFAELGSDMSSLLSLAKLLRVAYVAAGWQPCAKLTSEHATPLTSTAPEGALQ